MYVCIIGNKGSFMKDVNIHFNAKGILTRCYYSNDIFGTPLSKVIDVSNCNTMLYIGGETRYEGNMAKHNVLLPRDLFFYCLDSKIKFVYLSTLSVFGWNDDDVIDVTSHREPYDFYGVTKNQFDQIRKGINYDNFVALYPASIDSGRGRSSVEKFKFLMTKYQILQCIRLPGCLSIISREDLIAHIYHYCVSDDRGDYVISKHKQLSEFSKPYAVPLPKAPQILFRLLKSIIGPKRSMLLKMLLRGVQYK